MEGFWKTPDSNMRVPLEFCFHSFKELCVPIYSKKKMLCIIAMAFRTELSLVLLPSLPDQLIIQNL